MARVAIVAIGTDDEIRPMIALADEMRRAGDDVRLATNAAHRAIAMRYGVECVPLSCDQFADLLTPTAPARDPQAMAEAARTYFDRCFESLAAEAPPACRGADCVLGSGAALYAAASLAEAAGAQFIECVLCPGPLVGHRDQVAHGLRALWQMQEHAINSILRPALGLPACSAGGAHGHLRRAQCPILCGFGQVLGPPPRTLPPYVHPTGFWHTRESESWHASEELQKFFGSDAKPIYVDFGRRQSQAATTRTAAVLEALKSLSQRAVFVGADRSIPEQAAASGGQFLFLDEAPRAWLLKRVKLAVHNAGTDITAEILRAGVPSVPAPVHIDEIFWAAALTRQGLAPNLIPSHAVTAANFAAAIEAAQSSRMLAAAQEARQLFALDTGARLAAAVVRQYAIHRTSPGALAG